MPARMQAVALDEEPPPPRAPRSDEPRRRVPLAAVLAGVLVLVALVAVQVTLDARDRTREDRLSDVAGVLQPLDGPLHGLWHLGGGEEQLVGVPVAGRAVSVRSGLWRGDLYEQGWTPAEDATIRGYDARTGRPVWQVLFPLDAVESAELRRRPSDPRWTWCQALTGPRLLCALTSPALGGTRVAVIDAIDGRVLTTRTLPEGAAWTTSGASLVVATRQSVPHGTGQGRAVGWLVVATDATTGAAQWHVRVPGVRPVDRVVPGTDRAVADAELSARDGRVLLVHSGHAWVLADGGLERDVSVGVDGWAELGPGGALVWAPWSRPSEVRGLLVLADGREVPVRERLAAVTVDDGSADDVLLLSGTVATDTLVARDARTGEVRWTARGVTTPAVVLDGVVSAGTVEGVAAWRASTGKRLLAVDLGGSPVFVGTDGYSLVAFAADGTLHGLAPDDGASRWTRDASTVLADTVGLHRVTAWDRHLLLTLTDGSAVLLASG
ncbi:PQQ-binding-like beta-propeller repeat protein [Cellulomonas sp.]|uniref:PQQ-binding-like beta-propeller repeat protein n=1 Tax=Cellulomonas sp. TaxID=40001 RepID=UPI00258441A1|nr:PQQ-binding-like beta-propeller repeat protein [Cellulomonas sp.]MCR6688221.1 PQQ-like beta-propeller repeat protein [Cellulomonas sp.]